MVQSYFLSWKMFIHPWELPGSHLWYISSTNVTRKLPLQSCGSKVFLITYDKKDGCPSLVVSPSTLALPTYNSIFKVPITYPGKPSYTLIIMVLGLMFDSSIGISLSMFLGSTFNTYNSIFKALIICLGKLLYILAIIISGLMCDSSTSISLGMFLGSTFYAEPLLINTLPIKMSLHPTMMYIGLLCLVPLRSNSSLIK